MLAGIGLDDNTMWQTLNCALEEKPQRSETNQTRLDFDDQGDKEKNNKDGCEVPWVPNGTLRRATWPRPERFQPIGSMIFGSHTSEPRQNSLSKWEAKQVAANTPATSAIPYYVFSSIPSF